MLLHKTTADVMHIGIPICALVHMLELKLRPRISFSSDAGSTFYIKRLLLPSGEPASLL